MTHVVRRTGAAWRAIQRIDNGAWRARALAPGDRSVQAGRIACDTDRRRRGFAVRVDLSDGWDFSPWLELTLEEARHRLGVHPRLGEHTNATPDGRLRERGPG
jgi:hypothetical protein